MAESSFKLLIQLSDPHLLAGAHAQFFGIPPYESLRHVINLILQEQPHPDLVLATGDLVQDGSEAAYTQFLNQISRIPAPSRWLAGNHDLTPVMATVTEGTRMLEPIIDIGNWRITLLDSSVPGEPYGLLDDTQLERLQQSLEQAPERHHLVCLHHHPLPVGSAWMDSIGLHDAEALLAIIERFPQVRALVCGHVHQEVDIRRGSLRLLASPSTCIQFRPHSETFQLDDKPAGYRWLRLHDDGTLATGVSRIDSEAFRVDPNATGY